MNSRTILLGNPKFYSLTRLCFETGASHLTVKHARPLFDFLMRPDFAKRAMQQYKSICCSDKARGEREREREREIGEMC